MHWHAEPSSLVLRMYERPDGYWRKLPFSAVAFAKFLGPGIVFIEGALRADGQPLTIADWRSMATTLSNDYGVKTVQSIRRGRIVEFEVARWIWPDSGAPTGLSGFDDFQDTAQSPYL